MRKKILFFLLIPFLGFSQVQIGQDIQGVEGDDHNGACVSLSADGSIVAVGSPNSSKNGIAQSGHVRIFKNISGSWIQVGNRIEGDISQSFSGRSVALSSDGNIVAIGATGNNSNMITTGQVRVYENISGVWKQMGNKINGKANYDAMGVSVSLSSDGSTLAVGAPGSGIISTGYVQIFKNISGVWTQIGSDINGEAGGDSSGWSISLSHLMEIL
ncbi:MAG: hypothetical protein RSF68_02780 [Myroides sp.]